MVNISSGSSKQGFQIKFTFRFLFVENLIDVTDEETKNATDNDAAIKHWHNNGILTVSD